MSDEIELPPTTTDVVINATMSPILFVTCVSTSTTDGAPGENFQQDVLPETE